MRRHIDRSDAPIAGGWSTLPAPRPVRRRRRHLPVLLLMLPLVLGLFGAPGRTSVAQGDELADAKAKQAQLKKEVAAQKAKVAQLNSLQGALSAEIRETKRQLNAIGADLSAVRKKIGKMENPDRGGPEGLRRPHRPGLQRWTRTCATSSPRRRLGAMS